MLSWPHAGQEAQKKPDSRRQQKGHKEKQKIAFQVSVLIKQ